MTLFEILESIVASGPNDWHAINDYPPFRESMESVGVGADQRVIGARSHHSVATFIPDASITMAWRYSDNPDFREPWAKRFSDPHVSSAHVDMFYNNALVYRTLYVLVDGARGYLPLLDRREAPAGVPARYAQFVHLLDRLAGHDRFEEFFVRAGFARMPDRPWPVLGRGIPSASVGEQTDDDLAG